MMNNLNLNLMIVGPEGCGKSTLFSALAGVGSEDKNMSFIKAQRSIAHRGNQIDFTITDTNSEEQHLRYRRLLYRNVHVVIIAFSLLCAQSYNAATSKWLNEVHKWAPHANILFVGCQEDIFLSKPGLLSLSHPFLKTSVENAKSKDQMTSSYPIYTYSLDGPNYPFIILQNAYESLLPTYSPLLRSRSKSFHKIRVFSNRFSQSNSLKTLKSKLPSSGLSNFLRKFHFCP